MIYKSFLILIIVFFAVIAKAQDTLNKTDATGKKQGTWIKYDDNKHKIYQGAFLNNTPIGKFTYFYDTGIPWAVTVFSKNGKVAFTQHFNAAGKITGEGKYINQKKDSLWKFYSDAGKLLSEEFYIDGVKNGRVKVYYANGKVSEDKTWKNGKLNGECKKYFESGDKKFIGNYINDKVEGKVTYYQASGKVDAEGVYKNDLKVGIWKYYNTDGTLKRTDEFKNGKMIKSSEKDYLSKEEAEKEKEKYKNFEMNNPFEERNNPE